MASEQKVRSELCVVSFDWKQSTSVYMLMSLLFFEFVLFSGHAKILAIREQRVQQKGTATWQTKQTFETKVFD